MLCRSKGNTPEAIRVVPSSLHHASHSSLLIPKTDERHSKYFMHTCINLLQPLQNMLIPSSNKLFCPGYIWGSWKAPLLLFSTTTHALPLRSRIKPLKWVAKQINWHWSLKQWNRIAIKPNMLKLGRYKTWSKYRLYVQFFSLLLKSEENKNKREGENAFR